MKEAEIALEPADYDLWLSLSLRVLGYSASTVESSLGRDRAISLEARVMSELDGQKLVVDSPTSLAHSLEAPNAADAFIGNADLAAGSPYLLYQAHDVSMASHLEAKASLLFTRDLKRLYKVRISDIIYA